jgi:hypothetical protein
MSGAKCSDCGLMNFAGATDCRRCGVSLAFAHGDAPVAGEGGGAGVKKRIIKSALRVFGLAGFILFLWYASLIGTSEPVVLDQRRIVDQAIDVLDRRGFADEVFVLRHLVYYRATDNWWNRRVGHESAFASTNFPFEVMTLYPAFFEQPVDEVERAAVLLHEAYHLFGYKEQGAVEGVWRDKKKLGWTKEKYANTPIWTNVKASTQEYAPDLLRCGPDRRSDCTE